MDQIFNSRSLAYVLYRYGVQIGDLLDSLKGRIDSGVPVKLGPIELGKLASLPRIEPTQSAIEATPEDWLKRRKSVYIANHNFFLTHVVEPSADPNYEFDIFIYVVRHKQPIGDEIESVEFFMGKHWGNRVFKEKPRDGLVGLSTSAYGPFLCVCRLNLKTGQVVQLERYVDFEMGRFFYSGYLPGIKALRDKWQRTH